MDGDIVDFESSTIGAMTALLGTTAWEKQQCVDKEWWVRVSTTNFRGNKNKVRLRFAKKSGRYFGRAVFAVLVSGNALASQLTVCVLQKERPALDAIENLQMEQFEMQDVSAAHRRRADGLTVYKVHWTGGQERWGDDAITWETGVAADAILAIWHAISEFPGPLSHFCPPVSSNPVELAQLQ